MQISFRPYRVKPKFPRMARYRRWRYAQSANFAFGEGRLTRIPGVKIRSSDDIDKKEDHHTMVCFFMAAELGFEPRHTESESAVLPLHNSAKF